MESHKEDVMKKVPGSAIAAIIALSATLAACGGGGGGGSSPGNGGGGGGGSVTPPTPAVTPNASGVLTLNGAALANAKAVYTCGCSSQAGSVSTDASGNVNVAGSANAIPSAPSPTYTAIPGRNYLIIGYANGTQAQTWTMLFLGSKAANNVNLAGNSTGLVSDTAANAAALFVYYDAAQKFSSAADQSFDQYNFNQIAAFAAKLRTSPNSAEQTLMNDIVAAQSSGTSMYPGAGVPTWNASPGATTNQTITNALKAVAASGDSALPTPCPSTGCSGAPTP